MNKRITLMVLLLTLIFRNSILYAEFDNETDKSIIFEGSINTLNSEIQTFSKGDLPLFSFHTDDEGNEYGPSDFVIENNKLYILDTSSNNIVEVENSRVKNVINLENNDNLLTPSMIAVDRNIIYALDIGKSYIAIKDGNKLNVYPIEMRNNQAIPEFHAEDDRVFITYVDEQEETCVYELSHETFVEVDTILGKIIDNYVYNFERDNNPYENHSGRFHIKNLDTSNTYEIEIYTKNLLFGAKLLGVDKNNNFVVQTKEENKNISNGVIEFVKKIDIDGTVVNEEVFYKQPSFLKTAVFENDELYPIDNVNNNLKIEVQKISNKPIIQDYLEYNLSNDNIEKITYDNNFNNENTITPSYSGITRSTIMNNAKHYHTSFYWNCTSANLKPLYRYNKPRFIASPGRYNSMPYCWGGFNTRESFLSGLNSGGRAGNIKPEGSGNYQYIPNTYGLDCSGYVSRCWGYGSKLSTKSIASVSYAIDYSRLTRGDALNRISVHVMLFDKLDSNGDYILYEATQMNSYDRVAHTIRSKSFV